MVVTPHFGNNLAKITLNSLGKYIIATQAIPWDLWSKDLKNPPVKILYCETMEFEYRPVR